MSNKYAIDYDPTSGVMKSMVWDSHCPQDGKIVTEQLPSVRKAIYDRNAKLRNEGGSHSKESAGLIADIAIEDMLQLQRDYPEHFEPYYNPVTNQLLGYKCILKGEAKRKWWRKVINQNPHFATTEKIIEKRRAN